MTRRAPLVLVLVGATIAGAPVVAQSEDAEPASPAPVASTAPASSADKAGYLVSDLNFFPHDEILWPGFLTGMEGFDHFYDPISNPLYHESAIVKTQAKFLYLYHEFPDGNALDGGQLNSVALQLRVALTDRLAFIATKDGYTWFDPGLYPEEEEGLNDLAVGAKYALIADEELDLVFTIGARYEWRFGKREILQKDNDEISPFLSVAKGFDKLHLLANVTFRIPFDDDKANSIFQWSVHADYELFDGFAPMVELNGLHYLSDADRTPLDVGGYDYANLGSTDVSGNSVVTLAVGAALRFTPNFTIGATYEFPLTDADDDIIEQRVTVAATFTY